jgi:hypothetical protein
VTTRHTAALLLCLLLGESAAFGYMMRGEFSLEELEKTAGVVFKGTVVSSVPDTASPGDQVTQFKLVSVIKGMDPGPAVTFRHIDQAHEQLFDGPGPVHYHFDTGKTYLVFAKASGTPGVFQPLWEMPQSEGNQGVLLCADDKAVAAANLKDEVWAELTGLLQHKDNGDVLYAVQKLDQMSGGGWGEGPPKRFDCTLDFDRKPVLDAVHGFVASSDPQVAQAAIETVGSHNPYMSQERAEFWLATVGSGEISGLVKMKPKMENLGGELYWTDLVAVANSAAPETTRALAIRALGLVKNDEIAKHLDPWLADPAPEVRAAALVLHAAYPVPPNSDLLNKLAADPSPDVRIAVAQCVGFGQQKLHLDVLGQLLTDSDPKVRQAAAMNALSFSPRDPAVEGLFKLHAADEEFAPLFTLALAREDPAPYLEELVRIMATPEGMPTAPNGWGGQVPSYTARDIVLKYLKTLPDDELKSGKLEACFDAIDHAALNNMGSPFEAYAFYIRHGLTARAQTLRDAALKAFPYQQAISYDQAREHPEIYDQ